MKRSVRLIFVCFLPVKMNNEAFMSLHPSLTQKRLKQQVSLIFFLVFLYVFRPAGPAEREAHRAASGDSASLPGAASENKPPRLSAAVRQGAPEDDGPPSDGHRPRPAHPAAEED